MVQPPIIIHNKLVKLRYYKLYRKLMPSLENDSVNIKFIGARYEKTEKYVSCLSIQTDNKENIFLLLSQITLLDIIIYI